MRTHYTNLYMVQLSMTLADAMSASHQGQCDEDVEALCRKPEIARQLDSIDPENLARELKEYGAWDSEQLADHEENKRRFVWLAAGDIVEEARQRHPVLMGRN